MDRIEQAMSLDLTKYENLKLLWEVIRRQEGCEAQAKKAYFIATEQIRRLAESDPKQALKFYELARGFAFTAAKTDFDMYMTACEWNREPAARFWAPRRAVLEGKHHIATIIQDFIDDKSMKFLSLSFPPGTGKTTLIKFLLAYISGRSPMSANMYVSYSDGMVKMIYDSEVGILTDTSEYCHNEIFTNGPPKLSAEYNTISYRKKGDFPTMGIISLGGSVTGRTRANGFMITDDLVKNAEEARNAQRLDKLWEDYSSTLTTRMIGSKVKQIMLGTIWSLHDPISRMRAEHENDLGYKFVAIPVWDENENSNFEYDHPDNYTPDKIREIKESLDPVTFDCLYMQSPREREGILFSESELMTYNGVLPEGEPDVKVFVCDVAYGGGDRLAMPILYIYGDRMYLEDVVFNGGDKDTTMPIVISKITSHRLQAGQFEANNGGEWYAEAVDSKVRGVSITSKRAPNTIGKTGRIVQYAPDIKKIYFRDKKHRSQEYQQFVDEVCRFSIATKKQHDDAPDSLAQLMAYLQTMSVVRVEVFKRPF